MFRKSALSLAAVLAIGTVFSFAPAPFSLVTPASAGTYEDNVFPRGFPRWGSSPRYHEDRNLRPRRAKVDKRHRRPTLGQQRGNVRQTGHWQAQKKFRRSTTTTVHTSRHLRYRGRIVVPATAATAGYFVSRQHYSGYGHVAPQPVFRAPEDRGLPVSYERSTTGECPFGFRFIAATGECI